VDLPGPGVRLSWPEPVLKLILVWLNCCWHVVVNGMCLLNTPASSLFRRCLLTPLPPPPSGFECVPVWSCSLSVRAGVVDVRALVRQRHTAGQGEGGAGERHWEEGVGGGWYVNIALRAR